MDQTICGAFRRRVLSDITTSVIDTPATEIANRCFAAETANHAFAATVSISTTHLGFARRLTTTHVEAGVCCGFRYFSRCALTYLRPSGSVEYTFRRTMSSGPMPASARIASVFCQI